RPTGRSIQRNRAVLMWNVRRGAARCAAVENANPARLPVASREMNQARTGRPRPPGQTHRPREESMRELIHQRVVELIDRQGTVYDRARVYAERQSRGTWAAWVEFVSAKRDKVLQTDREATQSTLEGVAYWATGL